MTDAKAKDEPIEFYVSGINFKEVNLETIHSCTGFITSYDAGKAETVYVIEYSAYRELEAKLAIAVEALGKLKYIGLQSNKYEEPFEMSFYAYEALQELGEA